jgi:hypothetical protein
MIEIIQKYDIDKTLNGCAQKTRYNYIRLLLHFSKEVGKPFNLISKNLIVSFIAIRNGFTLEQYKLNSKDMFKYWSKNRSKYQ